VLIRLVSLWEKEARPVNSPVGGRCPDKTHILNQPSSILGPDISETERKEQAMKILVVVTGPDHETSCYVCKIVEFDAAPSVGDMLFFNADINGRGVIDSIPCGKLESIDWHEGHAMAWCDGNEEFFPTGGEVSDLINQGWKVCDPWYLTKEFTK
jgi:hypothetical protein